MSHSNLPFRHSLLIHRHVDRFIAILDLASRVKTLGEELDQLGLLVVVDDWQAVDNLYTLLSTCSLRRLASIVTYHEGVETFLHAHIVALLKIAEVDFIFLFLKVVVGQLVEAWRHDCDLQGLC
jgi:hypothetical protein